MTILASKGEQTGRGEPKPAMSEPARPDFPGYDRLLQDIKGRVRAAQIRAALSVNGELVLLYWQIGRDILERQQAQGWGAKVIDRLALDLKLAFPQMQGFGPRNLRYMRAFAEAWPDEAIVQGALAQITWWHNLALLEKLKDSAERLWYAEQAVQNGWGRNVLVHQIETRFKERVGQAVTNFERSLPAPQSDLARQLLKDPYNFDFLTVSQDAEEREVERGLLEHIRQFLLELGTGFAFLGSQYHLEVGGEDFYLDLLFFHVRLRCYVVIDLKAGKFQPEFAGKMNFYLSAVDDLLRHPQDAPSIGIILCREKNKVVAEYALRDLAKPLGVAQYQLTEALPEELKGNLPTIEALEEELAGLETEDAKGEGKGDA